MAKSNQGIERNVENETVPNQENSVNRGTTENVANAAQEGVAANVSPAAPVGLEAVLGMLAQVLARLPGVSPVVINSPPVNSEPSVNVTQESRTASTPSYLKVMEHMQRLGTKFFTGGARLIEADEWMSRLQRNFDSIRCPQEFKTDIAIHHLEGEAHMWWLSISGRRMNPVCDWETFCNEFRVKYFPPEALDRLEGAFMKVSQGSKTVREYESEFNNLKKYSGHEKEEESAHVRRFMRGLRIELRKICLVRNYSSVSELVEKAAQLEGELEGENNAYQERKVLATGTQVRTGGGSGQGNKRWNRNSTGKETQTTCATCGKNHMGVCKFATGECFRCGSLEHKARECPMTDTRGKGIGSDARKCYHCGESGHLKANCPKFMQSGGKRANDGLLPPLKRQAVTPRVYTMAAEQSEPSTSQPITGESYQSPM